MEWGRGKLGKWKGVSGRMSRRVRKPKWGMKFVVCEAYGCKERRIHWDMPYTPRGPQLVQVPIDHIGPAFCSLTCYMLRNGELNGRSVN